MPSPEGKIVELWLVTDDDTLAAAFAADLAARETQNPVTRFHSFDDCLDALGMGDQANGACIAVLDVRSAPRDGLRFLNEVHKRQPFGEPVVFLIGADDREREFLDAHGRFIAGQLPTDGAGAAFVDWATSMLAENWSFEAADAKD